MRFRSLSVLLLHRPQRNHNEQRSRFTRVLSTLKRSPKPRYECTYCKEQKLAKDLVIGALLPWACQAHLTAPNQVCALCLEAALSAQLDCKPLLAVGCPHCGTAWEPEEVKTFVGAKDRKRLRELDAVAQTQVYVPAELPDQPTLDDMLARGVRLCPFCRFPFVKLGGCDSMLCEFFTAFVGSDNSHAKLIVEERRQMWPILQRCVCTCLGRR